MKVGNKMTLKEAIEVLKERSAWIKQHFDESTHAEAIDTVVEWAEKPIPTLKESDDKRLLFYAYLQGKRDQIYWATKWEELKPIGKYRIMKQFLAWYKTLKLKEETK